MEKQDYRADVVSHSAAEKAGQATAGVELEERGSEQAGAASVRRTEEAKHWLVSLWHAFAILLLHTLHPPHFFIGKKNARALALAPA
jgi:hypothetical protein